MTVIHWPHPNRKSVEIVLPPVTPHDPAPPEEQKIPEEQCADVEESEQPCQQDPDPPKDDCAEEEEQQQHVDHFVTRRRSASAHRHKEAPDPCPSDAAYVKAVDDDEVNLRNKLTSVVAERDLKLGELQQTMSRLEASSKMMLEQTKMLAEKESTKKWWNLWS